ncbi:unnamed protein product [Tenebrio molitor]|nr:unnamed protein product [Tenebrio molitor]
MWNVIDHRCWLWFGWTQDGGVDCGQHRCWSGPTWRCRSGK